MRRNPWRAIGSAAVAVAAGLLVRTALGPALKADLPFVTLFSAVVVASMFGGLWAGVLATALGAISGALLFPGPGGETAGAWAFLVFGTLTALLTEILGARYRRAEQQVAALRAEHQRRVAVSAALRESETRFRSMADVAPVLIWMAGPEGVHEWFNRAWLEFTGRPADRERGAGWLESVHSDDLAATVASAREALAARRPFEREFRLRRHDGAYRQLVERAVPHYESTGAFAGYVGTAVDVTDQRDAIRALQSTATEREMLLERERRAREQAEAANRLKDEFLATVSHELRTPLNAVLAWAQLLRRRADPRDLERGLEVIERNARLQGQVVSDLLDISRMSGARFRLDLRSVQVRDVVEAALEAFRPAADARHVTLRARHDSSLAPVHGDPARLQQIVGNLLSNAIKFTPPRGSVDVTTEATGDGQVAVTVRDDGEGIDPAFLPHVFERFRQADGSTSRRHGGLGLGLAIARHLAELHGGTIDAYSPGPGLGSRFTVRLPVAHQLIALDGVTSGTYPDLHGRRVLVVDDDRDAAEAVRLLLESADAVARAAESAGDALAVLEAFRPDLVISDIGMPGEDGFALVRRVRALPAERGGETPLIALSAYAGADDRRAALDAGFEEHMAKPADPARLIGLVAAVAGSPRARGAA